MFFTEDAMKKEGTYAFEKMSYVENGVYTERKTGDGFMGIAALSKAFLAITLGKRGAAEMTSNVLDEEERLDGAWRERGKRVELTFDGETLVCACDGETLTIEQDDVRIVLKK